MLKTNDEHTQINWASTVFQKILTRNANTTTILKINTSRSRKVTRKKSNHRLGYIKVANWKGWLLVICGNVLVVTHRQNTASSSITKWWLSNIIFKLNVIRFANNSATHSTVPNSMLLLNKFEWNFFPPWMIDCMWTKLKNC